MKIYFKTILFLLSVLFTVSTGFAQNTGYLGKKIGIKTNLINGIHMPVSEIEVEYVFSRILSLNYSVESFSYQPSDVIRKDSRLNPWSPVTTITPYESSGYSNNLGLKLYFDKIIPAPLGMYTFFDLGYGSVLYGYEYKRENVEYSYSFTEKTVVDEGRKKAVGNFLKFSAPSFGYQTVLCKFILIDARFSFEGFVTDGNIKYRYKYVSSNLISGRLANIIYGPALYLKAGILLF